MIEASRSPITTQTMTLVSRDGREVSAFVARPATALGGVVIAQEMYGVNRYLQNVCAFYASYGYVSIAPALYDRHQAGLVFSYTKDDHDRARTLHKAWDLEVALDDMDAARKVAAEGGKVGVVGFCWGGTLSWLAACRRDYACAVSYYGSSIPDFADEQPKCPVIGHIGALDRTLPNERIEQFRALRPEVPVYIYPGAQHGFDNADRTGRHHPEACVQARQRTVEFFRKHLG